MTEESGNVYHAVDCLTKRLFLRKHYIKKIINDVRLNDIVNLHNNDGISDLNEIDSMLNDIETGKEILMENGFPNIKIVFSKLGEYVLFDGHHTTLAYLDSGRKFLSEVPHLLVKNTKTGCISDKEINVFFGNHAPKLKNENWRNYVINWQAPFDKQLCIRVQNNMEELFNSIRRMSIFTEII